MIIFTSPGLPLWITFRLILDGECLNLAAIRRRYAQSCQIVYVEKDHTGGSSAFPDLEFALTAKIRSRANPFSSM